MNKIASTRYTQPLHLIHSDLHGPLPVHHHWMAMYPTPGSMVKSLMSLISIDVQHMYTSRETSAKASALIPRSASSLAILKTTRLGCFTIL